MTYIIENANVLDGKKFTITSFLIKQDKIASILPSTAKLKHMRMDAKAFIVTPTYVMYDPNIPEGGPFREIKNYFLEQFIKRGCTTVLTTADILFESEFSVKMKRKHTSLFTSPIDYIVAVKIPVRLLTPSFIRKCKKEKVPAIFVEMYKPDELDHVPWGWIREALFPYNPPLVPVFAFEGEKERQRVKEKWMKIVLKEKIPSLKDEIQANVPIPKQDLAKIGIYPLKGGLQQGSEISYNMYVKDHECRQVDEMNLFLYHNHRLVVTMHKGKIIRTGEKAFFRSGFGEKVTVKMPSFYTI
jgi:hypothetical protein